MTSMNPLSLWKFALAAGIVVLPLWGCAPTKVVLPEVVEVKPKPIDLTPDRIDVSKLAIQKTDRKRLRAYAGPSPDVFALRLMAYINRGPDLTSFNDYVTKGNLAAGLDDQLYDSLLYVAWSDTAPKRKTSALKKVVNRTGDWLVSLPADSDLAIHAFLVLGLSHEELSRQLPPLKKFHVQSALRYYAAAFNNRLQAGDPWWRIEIATRINHLQPNPQQILTLQKTSNKYSAHFRRYGKYKYAALWAQTSFDLCFLQQEQCGSDIQDRLTKTMIKMWQYHIAKVKKGKAGVQSSVHKEREIGRAYLSLFDRLKTFRKGTSEFYLRQAQRYYRAMLSHKSGEVLPAWQAEARYALRSQ